MYQRSDDEITLEVELGNDKPELVENADAWLTLADQTRWSITFLTYSELGRIMDRWASSGEGLGGRYFTCPDLVILRRPGVREMWDVIKELVASGDYIFTLRRI